MLSDNVMLEFSKNIKTIDNFIQHTNSPNNNVFVCLIGEAGNYILDINRMDNILKTQCAYVRISSLPAMPPEKVAKYDQKYNDWIQSFKSGRNSSYSIYNEKEFEQISLALSRTVSVFRKSRKNITDSIEKNFVMKLLFWYEDIFEDLDNSANRSYGVKIAADNIQRVQEYLFYYFTALMGADVLLLQNKTDLDTPIRNLNLSGRTIMGHLGNSEIPPYTRIHIQNSSSYRSAGFPPTPWPSSSVYGGTSLRYSSDRNVTPQRNNINAVPAPPRQNRQSSSFSPQPSSGNNRGTIPPRPDRQNTPYTPIPSSGNNRVTIPPRPDRQNTPYTPIPSSGNNRVTIPPRPDRQNTPYTPIPSSGNNRVTKPPRPDRQNTPYTPIPSSGNNRVQNNRSSSSFSGSLGSSSSSQPRREKTYEELAQYACSVVQIFSIRRQSNSSDRFQILGSGSGIMISSNGYILTNYHVTKASHDFAVRVENDEKVYFTNRLIKYHSDFDLAIIRIDRKLTPIRIYQSPQPLVRGQRVVAIGSPQGLFNTVSDGIISGFRTIDMVDMIQFTAPISNGSSGGALINMYGELIGISTSGIDDGQNINFAVDYKSILNFTRGVNGL